MDRNCVTCHHGHDWDYNNGYTALTAVACCHPEMGGVARRVATFDMQSAPRIVHAPQWCPVAAMAEMEGKATAPTPNIVEKPLAVIRAAINESRIRNDPLWRSGDAARGRLATELRQAERDLDAAVAAMEGIGDG